MPVPTQHRVLDILNKSSQSTEERQQLVLALRKGCYDMPDVAFESSYEVLKSKSASKDQKYIDLQELILNATKIKVPAASIKKYLQGFVKQIGATRHVQRMAGLVDYVFSGNKESIENLIREDLTDLDSRKRLLTAYKRENRIDEYVRKLNIYLEENPSDTEAWIELFQLYVERGQYLRALFCLQEIIVIHPENNHYMVKLAELYFTLGGKQNLAHAIKYFSHVVSRFPKNVRALWGLYRSLSALGDKLTQGQSELMQLCEDSLNNQYSKRNPKIALKWAF